MADRQFAVTTQRGTGIARYFANGSLQGNRSSTRALIVIHGVLRDADYYYDTALRANEAAHAEQTLLIAPQFVEKDDLRGQEVPAQTLYWDAEWAGGSDAVAPVRISTYDVLDAMIARLSDRNRFPALRSIVVVGHSAGGQYVQRYAAVGKSPQLDDASRVRLVVANPSSYFYFTDWRPVPQRHCPDFNHWRYGLIGSPRYITGNASQLEARYVARHVTYLLGTADTNPNEDDLDRSCGGEAQGPYRFARGKNYIAYIRKRHPAGTAQDYAFATGVPHANRRMFTSPCGLAVLFGAKTACMSRGKV